MMPARAVRSCWAPQRVRADEPLAVMTLMGAACAAAQRARAKAQKTAAEAQKAVVEELRENGLLREEEPYKHSVPFSHRSGARVEPIISLQWFCDMSRLAEPAIAAVEHRRVHGLVARDSDLPRGLLGLPDQVEPVGELTAELERAHAQPVQDRRTRDGIEVPAVGQRAHELVHRGPGQVEQLGDLRCRQGGTLEEQLEDVQCASHRGNSLAHASPIPSRAAYDPLVGAVVDSRHIDTITCPCSV